MKLRSGDLEWMRRPRYVHTLKVTFILVAGSYSQLRLDGSRQVEENR